MRLPRVGFTVRRMMIAVAVLGAALGGLVDTMRKARRYDRMGRYHREQVVGSVSVHYGPDGERSFSLLSVDPKGRAIPERRRRLDRWHLEMAQRYWRAPYYPWSPVPKGPSPPE